MKDYNNQITPEDVQLAAAISTASIGKLDFPPIPIPIGSVNKVFRVESNQQPYIVRLTQEDGKMGAYRKEQWCANESRKLGVSTPAVLQIGEMGDAAFMIQAFVAGKVGTDPTVDQHALWRSLGHCLSKISLVSTEGLNPDLRDPELEPSFSNSWDEQVAHNIAVLESDDELQQRGYLTRGEAQVLKAHFIRLQGRALPIGLCHGDISPRNAIVDPTGQVHILDWGSARANSVPYSDIVQILRSEQPSADEFGAFLNGYGMTFKQFDEIRPILAEVALLAATDTLRWAVNHQVVAIRRYIAWLRWALAMTVENADWLSIHYTEEFGLPQPK